MANQRQRGNDIGPTGQTVSANIARVRKSQQVSLQELERRLIERGRRISLSGLSKIENNDRKVDVDDLMAIALALDVSPIALLLPEGAPDATATVSGGRGSLALLWQWAMGDRGLSDQDERRFQARSLPGWLTPNPDLDWYGDIDLGFALPDEADLTRHLRIEFSRRSPHEPRD